MLHALYNRGTIISPDNRNVKHILDLCEKYKVELLPDSNFLKNVTNEWGNTKENSKNNKNYILWY